MTDKDLNAIIRRVPNYPKKGIVFYDITSLLANAEAFSYVIDRMIEIYKDKGIEAIAGADARGFLFAAPLAYKMKLPFIPIRKAGKLPGVTLKASYTLEYGKGEVEVHADDVPKGKNILMVDDLLATGGTLRTSVELLERGGAVVKEVFALIGLTFLPYKERLKGYNVTTLIDFDNEKIK
ncbi:MAG: adenine phosphoribosyltransferase [Spirochaetaceae bacterium]|nr:adenine phosphoribosyltransferase [Spirochaetaceae bacterium]